MIRRNNFSKRQKGFTLIELMVIIAIIGTFALLGLLFYLGQQVKAKVNVDIVDNTIQVEECAIKKNQALENAKKSFYI